MGLFLRPDFEHFPGLRPVPCLGACSTSPQHPAVTEWHFLPFSDFLKFPTLMPDINKNIQCLKVLTLKMFKNILVKVSLYLKY